MPVIYPSFDDTPLPLTHCCCCCFAVLLLFKIAKVQTMNKENHNFCKALKTMYCSVAFICWPQSRRGMRGDQNCNPLPHPKKGQKSMNTNTALCSSRKYPYSPHGRFIVLHPPSLQEIPVYYLTLHQKI